MVEVFVRKLQSKIDGSYNMYRCRSPTYLPQYPGAVQLYLERYAIFIKVWMAESTDLPLLSLVEGVGDYVLCSWSDPSTCRSAEPALLPCLFGTEQSGLPSWINPNLTQILAELISTFHFVGSTYAAAQLTSTLAFGIQ